MASICCSTKIGRIVQGVLSLGTENWSCDCLLESPGIPFFEAESTKSQLTEQHLSVPPNSNTSKTSMHVICHVLHMDWWRWNDVELFKCEKSGTSGQHRTQGCAALRARCATTSRQRAVQHPLHLACDEVFRPFARARDRDCKVLEGHENPILVPESSSPSCQTKLQQRVTLTSVNGIWMARRQKGPL